MDKDLHFSIGNRYSIALLVLFITYFLFELPSTLSLRYIGPRQQLCGLAVSWGAVMLGMGFANDWRVIVVCRMLIGIFEAGFLPCCMYLLSCWYMRYEVQKRSVSSPSAFSELIDEIFRADLEMKDGAVVCGQPHRICIR